MNIFSLIEDKEILQEILTWILKAYELEEEIMSRNILDELENENSQMQESAHASFEEFSDESKSEMTKEQVAEICKNVLEDMPPFPSIGSKDAPNYQEDLSQKTLESKISEQIMGQIADIIYYKLKDPEASAKAAQEELQRNEDYFKGITFDAGIGEEQSCNTAFVFYKKAADQGHGDAQTMIAYLYEVGLGTEKSLDLASKYYKLAADQGNILAKVRLGLLKVINESDEEAYLSYTETRKREGRTSWNDVAAWSYLADAYMKGVRVRKSEDKTKFYYGEVINYFKGFSDGVRKDAKAQALIGKCYELGIGVEKSDEMALNYYKLAAEQGEPIAKVLLGHYLLKCALESEKAVSYLEQVVQPNVPCPSGLLVTCLFDLGYCFEKGIGTSQSYDRAFHYYKLAADRAHDFAQAKLGELFEEGHGVTKSDKDAVICYRKSLSRKDPTALKLSADNGFTMAQIILGKFYCGTAKSMMGFDYYLKAAGKGNAVALCLVGKFYKNGSNFVKENIQQALSYFRQAANKGSLEAMCQLAFCYEQGRGVDISREQAFRLYKQAADNNYGKGLFGVARCYRMGLGVKESWQYAKEYYKKAFDKGYKKKEAKLMIELCERQAIKEFVNKTTLKT